MGVSRAIVWGMLVTLFLCISVMMVEYFVPLNAKSQFDYICRGYMIKAETYGGLSSDDVDKLKDELGELGLKNIEVDYPNINSKKKGQDINLKVEGLYSYNQISGIIVRKDKELNFVYDISTVSKRVTNN
ncbi:MAG: hypothetical protein N4A76_11610 [Firmicutes bacterium]|jgi:hypothetical protein|nr:hypothetical protein [Bacillota bacterium]